MSGKMVLEILSADGKEWNTLNSEMYGGTGAQRQSRVLEKMKEMKIRWYHTVFFDRPMRVVLEDKNGRVQIVG